MKKGRENILRIAIFALVVICVLANVHLLLATDKDEADCISIPFSKTIIVEQGEEYVHSDDIKKYGKYYLLTDSCYGIDTLVGRALYYLYFDTTNMVLGQELKRTKDSLVMVAQLNRVITGYRPNELKDAPQEIVLADSLIRRFLHSKRIWLDEQTPYFLPFHDVWIDFTITPKKK